MMCSRCGKVIATFPHPRYPSLGNKLCYHCCTWGSQLEKDFGPEPYYKQHKYVKFYGELLRSLKD